MNHRGDTSQDGHAPCPERKSFVLPGPNLFVHESSRDFLATDRKFRHNFIWYHIKTHPEDGEGKCFDLSNSPFAGRRKRVTSGPCISSDLKEVERCAKNLFYYLQ